MDGSTLNELRQMMRGHHEKKASQSPSSDPVPGFQLDDDGEEYIGVGIPGVLASTAKLLAVSRGLVSPDERDNLSFKKTLRTEGMLKERIKMDAGKTARQLMYRAARKKNLSVVGPSPFDSYIDSQLIGNPLTAPLEEINPLQLVEAARRLTQMGPGGLGSDRSITQEAQNVSPSQFGFISPYEGPESSRAGIDVRLATGAMVGSDGRLYQKFYDRHTKTYRWMNPEDVSTLTVKIPD